MASESHKDSASVRFPPPLVFVLLMGAGMGIDVWWRPWPAWIYGTHWLTVAVAVSMGLLALALFAASLGLFFATGQRPEPWTTTPTLITDGIYAHSRNPMYAGMAVAQVAIGVGVSMPTAVVLTPLALWIVYRIAVRPEEAYLSRKFGDEYTAYCRRVRRWL